NPPAVLNAPVVVDVASVASLPAMVVGVIAASERVIAGVVVALATVPEIPFAVVTDTDVTVPALAVPPFTPPVLAASAVSTVPLAPTVVIPAVPAPVPENTPPLAMPEASKPNPPRASANSPVTVDVERATVNPAPVAPAVRVPTVAMSVPTNFEAAILPAKSALRTAPVSASL